MNKPCPFCDQAVDNPDYPVFQSFCRGCTIRGLAQSPQFHKAEKNMGVEAYQIALKNLLGPDWRASHHEVMAEAQRIKHHRAMDANKSEKTSLEGFAKDLSFLDNLRVPTVRQPK